MDNVEKHSGKNQNVSTAGLVQTASTLSKSVMGFIMVSTSNRRSKVARLHPAAASLPPSAIVKIGKEPVDARCCSNCGQLGKTNRRRTFSEQAWTVLLLWNEVTPAAVEQPMCEECYNDLRETLIERNSEIETMMQNPEQVQRIQQQLANAVP